MSCTPLLSVFILSVVFLNGLALAAQGSSGVPAPDFMPQSFSGTFSSATVPIMSVAANNSAGNGYGTFEIAAVLVNCIWNSLVLNSSQGAVTYKTVVSPSGSTNVQLVIGQLTTIILYYDDHGNPEPACSIQIQSVHLFPCLYWYTSTLPASVNYPAGASVGNFALVAGGENQETNSLSSELFIYNASSGAWSQTTLAAARSSIGATSIAGNVALFAGGNSDTCGGVSAIVDIYYLNGTLTASTLPSGGRAYIAATTVGPLALFAGGRTSTGVSNAVDIYDGNAHAWRKTTLPNGAHDHMAATSVGDLAIFAGGYNTTRICADVMIYNTYKNTWTVTALPGGARTAIAATSVGGLAFFAGGLRANGSASSVIDIYNTFGGTWRQYTMPVPVGLYGMAATTIGNLAVFSGGHSSGSSCCDGQVFYYDSDTSRWTVSYTTLLYSRYNLVAMTVGTKVIFAGGTHDGSSMLNAGEAVDILETGH